MALDRHVLASLGALFLFAGVLLRLPVEEGTTEIQELGRGNVSPRNGSQCPEVTMILFSRAVRMIVLATTTSVAATSCAFAEDPRSPDHSRAALPIQHVVNWSDNADEQPFRSENGASTNKRMADMMIKHTGVSTTFSSRCAATRIKVRSLWQRSNSNTVITSSFVACAASAAARSGARPR
jgi:hypothetical protein